MEKGGKHGALEKGGEEMREGSTGARRRGEGRRKHWSTEERIKGLEDGTGKGRREH